MSGTSQDALRPTSGRDAAAPEVIELRITDMERIEFQKAAERSGLSLAAWIRDRLNEAIKREAKEA
jgi:predicted HicB family RNase H-like nuclease